MLWLLVLLLGGCHGNQMVPLVVFMDANNTFQGVFNFHANNSVNGWEVTLRFNVPVTKMKEWVGDIVSTSADKTEFVLVDKSSQAIKSAGANFQIQIFCEYRGTATPNGTAEFRNLGHDPFAPPAAQPNGDGMKYNLNEVLQKSILFYEAQRSGKLPAGNRIPWRGDSALNDSGFNGEDLTGGWFDAGDHVKFNFPMSGAVTLLAWGLLEFKDAYQDAGELDNMYDCIKWPLDYLMRCHVTKEQYYFQVGDGNLDHTFWGRPEEMTMTRPAFMVNSTHPGSDVMGEAAAAFAASYMAFKTKDPMFASKLLQHARDLLDSAEKFPGKYSDSLTGAGDFYGSYDKEDEMCWGAVWLYLATNETNYLTTAERHYHPGVDYGQNWDSKKTGCMVLLYNVTGKDIYLNDIEATFTSWMPRGSVPYTPKGLAIRSKWGSNRHAANMAFVALVAAEQGLHSQTYRKWAESQINYILGDSGRSYVVGFGNNPPTQPHHRGSSCPLLPAPCDMTQLNQPGPNPHVLYGGLVGGPGVNDDYADKRSDYVKNEVAVDYNAGFQSAVAGLKALYMRHGMS